MSLGRLLRSARKPAVITVAFVFVISLVALWSGTGCDNSLPLIDPVAGTVCRWDFLSSVDGLKLPNSVHLPSGYDPSKAYPMWVDLHALYSQPDINNDTSDPFSNELKGLADQDGFIIFAPWGRNPHGLFVDGLKKDQSPYLEPNLFDDFSSSAGSWTPSGGT